jgi:hypothetical protein
MNRSLDALFVGLLLKAKGASLQTVGLALALVGGAGRQVHLRVAGRSRRRAEGGDRHGTAACGRRVAKLYAAGDLFACRRCHGLAYASQQDRDRDTALSKLQRIKMRMAGSGSILEPFPPKPNGMHWRTYERLRSEHHVAESAWLRPYEVLRQAEARMSKGERLMRSIVPAPRKAGGSCKSRGRPKRSDS